MDSDTMAILEQEDELVAVGCECPVCGEARMDWLQWTEDDTVRCASCGVEYEL